MKHTKSMIYRPTEESRELLLYAENCGDLYRQMITPLIATLRKKAARGTYDPEKAADAFYHVATEASRRYNKDFGYSFSVTDRFTAAVDMEAGYREEVFYGLDTAPDAVKETVQAMGSMFDRIADVAKSRNATTA